MSKVNLRAYRTLKDSYKETLDFSSIEKVEGIHSDFLDTLLCRHPVTGLPTNPFRLIQSKDTPQEVKDYVRSHLVSINSLNTSSRTVDEIDVDNLQPRSSFIGDLEAFKSKQVEILKKSIADAKTEREKTNFQKQLQALYELNGLSTEDNENDE